MQLSISSKGERSSVKWWMEYFIYSQSCDGIFWLFWSFTLLKLKCRKLCSAGKHGMLQISVLDYFKGFYKWKRRVLVCFLLLFREPKLVQCEINLQGFWGFFFHAPYCSGKGACFHFGKSLDFQTIKRLEWVKMLPSCQHTDSCTGVLRARKQTGSMKRLDMALRQAAWEEMQLFGFGRRGRGGVISISKKIGSGEASKL